MKNNEIKTFYRQRLPHIQQVGAMFFVTFRLYGSIPKIKLKELFEDYETKIKQLKKITDEKERNIKIFNYRRKMFAAYDALLDKVKSGPMYFKDDKIAEIIKEQLHRFDGEFYDLISYTIMSNHVHILIDFSVQMPENFNDIESINYKNLDQVMKRIKGATANFCNKALGKIGQFWDRENYDIYIRNEKMMNNVIAYILNNPVKAGIVKHWRKYKWNFYKYE